MKTIAELMKLILFALTFVILVSPAVHAQFFEVCGDGSAAELIKNIKAHSTHEYRKTHKFDEIHYLQGALPPGSKASSLYDVLGFLDELKPRRAAVLFYAYRYGRLCTWLMPPSDSQIVQKVVYEVGWADFSSIRPRLMSALKSGRKVNEKLPVARQVQPAEEPTSDADVNKILLDARNLLLPPQISKALVSNKIDTLVVVPIFDIGTIPFAALPFEDKMLIDKMSIVIAPGFHNFQNKPTDSQHHFSNPFSNPVIAGDPEPVGWEDANWKFQPLPGARKEAEEVAKYFKTEPLIGTAASKKNINAKLQVQSGTGLIFLSTHGIADQKNPLDESFLLLSDGRWTAREMSQLKLKGRRPLVVMSACQTGLGKNFDVGTIGMAQAWEKAGASSVVMSIWSVDDDATRDLMVTFIKKAQQMPPDKALQKAMQATRDKHKVPALWAGFSVFGTPLR